MIFRQCGVLSALVVVLTACTVGPDYQRPAAPESSAFRHAEGWRLARPLDVLADEAWWQLYEDPYLNQLVVRLNRANQNIAVAEAQYRQAQALVESAWAARLPKVTNTTAYTRSGRGSNSSGTNTGFSSTGTGTTTTSTGYTSPTSSSGSSSGGSSITDRYSFSLTASWNADLWGKLRRTQESEQASMESSKATWASVRLAQQASLVQTYLQLRVLDAQQRLLDRTVEAYRRSLKLTQNQYEAGIVAKVDVTQAITQLKNTEAQAIDLHWQRAQYEHAIAVLVGVLPAELQLRSVLDVPKVPEIPLGIPARLLERRPDVAAAERAVISANAEIGVAKAAWFPDLTLNATGSYSNTMMNHLFTLPNRAWSLGPQWTVTLLDFGARRAVLLQSKALYDEKVATYRQTVLNSFQEVEDNLVQVQVLEREIEQQKLALDAAQDSLVRMENQYKAGMVDYLSVVNLQTTALTTERSLLTLINNRLTASVQLIAALGGGWDGNTETPPVIVKEQMLSQVSSEKEPSEGLLGSTVEKVGTFFKKSLTWLE